MKSKLYRMEKDLTNAELDKKIVERDLKDSKDENKKLSDDIENLNVKIADNKRMHELALMELNNLNENLAMEVIKLKDITQSLQGKTNVSNSIFFCAINLPFF